MPAEAQVPASKPTSLCHRVLVVFNTPHLYGMERAVIELFDFLRPEVEAKFLLTYTSLRLRLPLLDLIQQKQLPYIFLSDRQGWPRISKPRSLREAWKIVSALVRGNWDTLCAARRHDAIYLPGFPYAFLALAACLWMRLRGGRVFLHFHELLDPSPAQRVLAFLVTDCLHSTHFGYGVMTESRPYLKSRRHWIVPPRTEQPVAVKNAETVDFGAGRKLFFLGQISKDKGIDILLDAFREIAPGYPDVSLHIFGSGDRESFLEDQIRCPPLEGRVRWWGYLPQARSLLAQAYICVFPTLPSRVQESFGRSLIESMSLGVPYVCFAGGTAREISGPDPAGIVVAEENSGALAAALRRFLDDAEFHDDCSRQARRTFEEHYSDATLRSRWLDVFRRTKT
ncbi:MAG: glycosyltransferase family 4 protein [Candidatus Korobacteraceae bacterium]